MPTLVERKISLDKEITKITTDINDIKSQLTQYRCGNPRGLSVEWYSKANVALNYKKSKAYTLRQERDSINREINEKRRMAHASREALQNKLFYQKLKEVMHPSEFVQFISEVDSILDNIDI